MNWDRTRLEAISLRITKGSTPTTLGSAFTSSGVNFIKAEALNGDPELDSSGFAFVDEETHKNLLKRSVLAEDDVLITIAGAKIGACGRVKKKHLPANTNQAVGIVRIDTEKAHPPFVYYFFKQHETYQFIQGLNAQAAQPNINLATLGSIEIPLPTIETQRHIADAISAYDDLIATNQRRIALLEDAARRLYREWFVHLRFPGHEQVEVKDGVPKGWTRQTLGALCNSVDGAVVQTGPFGSQLHQHDYKDAGTPVVMPQDIVGDRIRMDKIAYVDEQTAHRLSRHRLQAFDIVFPRRGDIAKRALVELHQDGFLCGTGCLKISLPPEPLHPLLLYFQLAAPSMVKWIEGQAVGTTMLNLSGAILRSVECLVPGGGVQRAFVDHVRTIRQQIDLLEINNEQLAQARDLLLPKLMSGRLDVSGIRLPEEIAA